MRTILSLILALISSTSFFAQKTDTLVFYSKTFDEKRTVYVITPEFFKYQSLEVKLPVIYILDGQHEWFLNPQLSAITYLQYTHQIPQAIVVVIPLLDRVKECHVKDLVEDELPLHNFVTQELNEKINKYNPSDYKILIGHSFSASFALYSYYKSPAYYSAIIANTPLDKFKEIVIALGSDNQFDKSKIAISVGGKTTELDFTHRRMFDELKVEYLFFFNSIETFIGDYSSHNSISIVATPFFLEKVFSKFNSRFSSIPQVNDEYKLISKPSSIKDEISKIKVASTLGSVYYPPEIAELNSIASRYLYNNLNEYGIAAYEMAIIYFPKYYDFHLQLYELLLSKNIDRAKFHFNKAYVLLNTIEVDSPEKQSEIYRLDNERKKNNW